MRSLVVAYGLLGLALFLDNGALGPVSLPLVIATCVIVARSIARPMARPIVRLSLEHVVAVVLVVEAALVWVKPPGVYLADPAYLARALITVVALAAAAGALADRPASGGLPVLAILAVAGAAGLLVLHGSPAPTIDVFTIQQEGARDLWHGLDPYGASYRNPYTTEQTIAFFGAAQDHLSHYPYPPLSLLATSAAWRITGDVRHALWLAQLATGAGLYALARRRGLRAGMSVALATMYLAHPRGLFVLEQAWTEPLICAGFVASLWLLVEPARGLRRIALIAALALLFSAKQYSVLLVPMLLAPRFSTAHRRDVLAAFAITGAIALPFVMWNPGALFDDVVMFQIQQPFRWASLSIGPVIAFVSGWKPAVLSPIGAAAALIWSWRRVGTGAPGLALIASATLLGFFVAAKQAFCNYYYFAGLLVLCAAIMSAHDGAEPADAAPSRAA